MNYPSNKGVGETVIVFGLRGQYIVFAVIAVVAFIISAAILANTHIPILLVILILVVSVSIVFGGIIRINKRFGRDGLMKFLVIKKLPKFIRNSVEINRLIIKK